jgi:D-hydroxyproline dehydrogenase subunit alpha
MTDGITLSVNDRSVTVPPGLSVAAAVARSGEAGFRRSVSGEPRGPVCGMGICFECRVTIDGQAHQRSCQVMCREGMQVETRVGPSPPAPPPPNPPPVAGEGREGGERGEMSFNVLVVGAGPAGLAAAVAAAESGRSVGLVDDNPHPGGQIWRADSSHASEGPAALWLERVRKSSVKVLPGSPVVGQEGLGKLLIEQADGVACQLAYHTLIIASGARERFLPFPGWTLPNVMGAGGLQALVKSGLPIEGKRVAIAGTGPLLMAVAAYLCKRGADVCLVAEQARLGKLLAFGFGLLAKPSKLWEAARLRRQFRSVSYRTSCWPVAAEGQEKLARVIFSNGKKTWSEPCDYLACGFGLVPNVELAGLLGCKIANGAVTVNELQETSVPGVYCAGEATGIGGLEKALAEGQIAGYAATDQGRRAVEMFGTRQRALRFAQALDQAFVLRDELKTLAKPDTLVCRCEDVPLGKMQQYRSWRDAKLQTRCGMGPCQGRVCGTAAEYLFGWNVASVRPPVFPARVGALAE